VTFLPAKYGNGNAEFRHPTLGNRIQVRYRTAQYPENLRYR